MSNSIKGNTRRRRVVQRTVRPVMIVPPTVVFHQHLGLPQVSKLLRVEKLIPKAAVERLDVRVLPRTARRDVQRLDARFLQPLLNRRGYELRPVVAPQVLRRPAEGEQVLQRGADRLGPDAAFDLDRQTFTRIFIQNHQELQAPAVGGPVRHEVVAPHVVDPLGLAAKTPVLRVAQTLASSLLLRHFQALLTPESMHPFAIDTPAFRSQQSRDPTIAVARVQTTQSLHVANQGFVPIRPRRLIPLRAPRLIQNLACPTLRNLQVVAHLLDHLPPLRRAQYFPSRASFRIALSSDRSATTFFRREFSRWSSLSRLA